MRGRYRGRAMRVANQNAATAVAPPAQIAHSTAS
jgi:hypothetical protein